MLDFYFEGPFAWPSIEIHSELVSTDSFLVARSSKSWNSGFNGVFLASVHFRELE